MIFSQQSASGYQHMAGGGPIELVTLGDRIRTTNLLPS